MKHKSKKRTAYLNAVLPDRARWRNEQRQFCMNCGKKPQWLGLEIHEIRRKSQAQYSWGERCNYLLLCHECHHGPFDVYRPAYELAVKKRHDPDNYDLERWNELYYPSTLDRPRDVAFVTPEEVAAVYLEGT